ncbi:MAG: hypothetical protein KDD89_14180, partial [Anaerolineales bacterium]|nr:hypothetical protein [Anaerolineales bacterium]
EQQERPLLLLFEDLHWANESLAIFPHFTNHLHTWPLLILGTYRSDERPNLPQLLPNMQPMFLRRLPPTAVALLSQSMLGEAGKRPDLLTMLQKETEGNAFFLVELVRALAEEAGQLDAVGQMVLPQTLLPDGIQTIVARRLSRIPQTGHRLLQLTAVAGRELDLAVVRWLNHNQPFDSWLAVCAEAMVLEVQNGRWGFSHDKIREGILADLAPDTRRKSHEQVALALEALYATHQDYAAALAHHWQQADNPAKERFYAYAAGELAAKQYRNQEALAFLERAYTLTAAEDLAERLGCLLAQEKICYFLGDRTVQSDKLTVMVALAKRLGDSNLLAEVMFRRSIYSFVVGDIPQALNSTHIALEHAKIAGNLAVQGLANRSLGNVFTARGMVHEALHHFELSLALHQQEGDLLRIAISSINAGAISTHMGNHTRSCELLNQAVALLEQLDDQQYLSSCLSFRAYDNSRIGDVAAAQADAERAVALAESTNYKAGLGMGHLGLGMMAMAR